VEVGWEHSDGDRGDVAAPESRQAWHTMLRAKQSTVKILHACVCVRARVRVCVCVCVCCVWVLSWLQQQTEVGKGECLPPHTLYLF
jgi:hypothetical protein